MMNSRVFRCERCELTTPPMHVASDDTGHDILRAAGWKTQHGGGGGGAVCPSCASRPKPKPVV